MKKNWLFISSIVFLVDQIFKMIINHSFYYGAIKSIIPNFFYVTLIYNEGAAWSTLVGKRIFLIVISILALIFLLYYQKYFLKNTRNNLAFGFIYGGLLSNLLDRVIYGYVIDYLRISFGNYVFPIFNIADVFIVIGFGLLMYGIYKGEDRSGNKSK